jgi:hypothetical protein
MVSYDTSGIHRFYYDSRQKLPFARSTLAVLISKNRYSTNSIIERKWTDRIKY